MFLGGCTRTVFDIFTRGGHTGGYSDALNDIRACMHRSILVSKVDYGKSLRDCQLFLDRIKSFKGKRDAAFR